MLIVIISWVAQSDVCLCVSLCVSVCLHHPKFNRNRVKSKVSASSWFHSLPSFRLEMDFKRRVDGRSEVDKSLPIIQECKKKKNENEKEKK